MHIHIHDIHTNTCMHACMLADIQQLKHSPSPTYITHITCIRVLGCSRHYVQKLCGETRETARANFGNRDQYFQGGKGNSGIGESTFGNSGKLFQEFSEHITIHFYAPTTCM